MSHKAGFIAVVGRPNAGKSSLLNWLAGENLTMVSHKANATRKRANVICMHHDAQIIFVDTPGLHEKERLLNQFMLEEALKAISDCDLLLFLTPAPDDTRHYQKFLTLAQGKPHIVVMTKCDQLTHAALLQKIDAFRAFQEHFLALLPVSTHKAEQERFLDALFPYLPEHDYFYDTDILTTQHYRDIYRELIREAIFESVSDEIPYFADVLMEKIEEGDIERIEATLITEKESHKAILIGKEAQTIKRIGKKAREKIEALIGKQAYVRLVVTVKKGWTKDKKELKLLGYRSQT